MIFADDQGFPGGLVEGYYLYRRDKAQMAVVPIRIWYGQPKDPLTGEVMDRSLRWQFEIAGKVYGSEDPPYLGGHPVDQDRFDKIWPKCAKEEIDAEEYEYLTARWQWARENDPDDPRGGDIKVDPLTATLD